MEMGRGSSLSLVRSFDRLNEDGSAGRKAHARGMACLESLLKPIPTRMTIPQRIAPKMIIGIRRQASTRSSGETREGRQGGAETAAAQYSPSLLRIVILEP